MATNKKIIYTRHDGGVSVCTPASWAISMMGCGGIWDHFPPGYVDTQIERKIARGMPKDVARRYCMALQFGGCTTAEALELIRDGDCLNGVAHELWDASDVPSDRWFRDAWRRSHNGGPISVNLEKARPIQIRHIANALHEENLRRRDNLLPDLEIDRDKIRDRVMRSRDESELRSIWID